MFQALDHNQLADALSRWTQSVRMALGGEVVALDGKSLRRALNQGENFRTIVSAWATESGLLLGQRKVADKSNEITAVPELLRVLELAGCIVTADAMHCQKNIAKEIIEADAQYVLALKGNQGTAFAEIKLFLDEAVERQAPHLVGKETVEKGHGRIETRRYWQSEQIGWFADRQNWEGLRSVGLVESVRESNGQRSIERRYYLSSLPNDVDQFARAVRGHWSIENQLHWILDVVFGEDQSRARTDQAAENLAAMRRLAVNILRRDKTCKRSIKGKLMRAPLTPTSSNSSSPIKMRQPWVSHDNSSLNLKLALYSTVMTDVLSPDFISSLYVHVPFCAQKCEYCAFFSEAAKGETVNRYVDALVREMELVATDLKPKTIFFGGGTPSLLNLRQWETVIGAMQRLKLTGATEWTVECNPATVSLEKAKLMRDGGVNRISMGVQSLDENLLERLGRVHSREMVFKSFDTLRAAGFDNINIDLMFAIPSQTMEIWKKTLIEAMAIGSEHLSSYEVIYEEDTPLYQKLQAREFDVDEELACAMFEELLSATSSNGFQQYEIANFARNVSTHESEIPDRACQHNVNYWRGGSFYGLGPSAVGYVSGIRTKNWSNTTMYCEQLERGQRAVESREELEPLSRAGEIAAFGLRMNAGWPLQEFEQRTGFVLSREWESEIARMIELDYGRLDESRFQLTPKGLRYADWAAEQFLRI